MILGRLADRDFYAPLSEGARAALEYLSATDLGALAPGRYPILGDRVFALVQEYETRPLADIAWEAHRRHLDVQCMARGAERIGYAAIDRMRIASEDPERDLLRLEGTGDLFPLRQGEFALFGPSDAHAPGLALGVPELVKKVVVKIAVG